MRAVGAGQNWAGVRALISWEAGGNGQHRVLLHLPQSSRARGWAEILLHSPWCRACSPRQRRVPGCMEAAPCAGAGRDLLAGYKSCRATCPQAQRANFSPVYSIVIVTGSSGCPLPEEARGAQPCCSQCPGRASGTSRALRSSENLAPFPESLMVSLTDLGQVI